MGEALGTQSDALPGPHALPPRHLEAGAPLRIPRRITSPSLTWRQPTHLNPGYTTYATKTTTSIAFLSRRAESWVRRQLISSYTLGKAGAWDGPRCPPLNCPSCNIQALDPGRCRTLTFKSCTFGNWATGNTLTASRQIYCTVAEKGVSEA